MSIAFLTAADASDTVAGTLSVAVVATTASGPEVKPLGGATITWSVSSGSHVSAGHSVTDSLGVATTNFTLGTKAGVDTVQASTRGSGTATLLVTALPGSVAHLAFSGNLARLGPVGDTTRATPTATDEFGNAVGAYDYRWQSSDTTVATVDDFGAEVPGTVRAVRPGTATITATAGSLNASTSATVLAFASVTIGAGTTCGIAASGTLYCWGDNTEGSIGDGTTTDHPHPTAVGLSGGPSSASVDIAACELSSSGVASCWGPDGDGELGDGSASYATEAIVATPTPVTGAHVFSSISVGLNFACGVTTAHIAYCWGANDIGELGIDTLTSTCIGNAINRCSNVPLPVAGSLQFASVSAGSWEHTCGVTTTGAAYCWGSDGLGELGNTSTTQMCGVPAPGYACSHTPLPVQGGLTFQSVSAGDHHSCGLASDGSAYCWGFGTGGALGDGMSASSAAPVRVAGGQTYTAVTAGIGLSCGLTTSGALECWGGVYGPSPAAVAPSVQFTSMSVGDGVCGVATGHGLYCWPTRHDGSPARVKRKSPARSPGSFVLR